MLKIILHLDAYDQPTIGDLRKFVELSKEYEDAEPLGVIPSNGGRSVSGLFMFFNSQED